MQELEKILEEIKKMIEGNKVIELNGDGTVNRCIIDVASAWDSIKAIIHDHINDGWISVDERLPTMEEYQKDDGRFILDDGNRRREGLFDIYDKRFYSYRNITQYRAELYEDSGIIAWHPLPGPYCSERRD